MEFQCFKTIYHYFLKVSRLYIYIIYSSICDLGRARFCKNIVLTHCDSVVPLTVSSRLMKSFSLLLIGSNAMPGMSLTRTARTPRGGETTHFNFQKRSGPQEVPVPKLRHLALLVDARYLSNAAGVAASLRTFFHSFLSLALISELAHILPFTGARRRA